MGSGDAEPPQAARVSDGRLTRREVAKANQTWREIPSKGTAFLLTAGATWIFTPAGAQWPLIKALFIGGAGTAVWTGLQIGWVYATARIVEDRKELGRLRTEVEKLRAQQAQLAGQEQQKLSVIALCSSQGKDLLHEVVPDHERWLAWQGRFNAWDHHLKNVVRPMLSDTERNRLAYLPNKGTATVTFLNRAHSDRWFDILAVTGALDEIIDRAESKVVVTSAQRVG